VCGVTYSAEADVGTNLVFSKRRLHTPRPLNASSTATTSTTSTRFISGYAANTSVSRPTFSKRAMNLSNLVAAFPRRPSSLESFGFAPSLVCTVLSITPIKSPSGDTAFNVNPGFAKTLHHDDVRFVRLNVFFKNNFNTMRNVSPSGYCFRLIVF